MCLSLQMGRVGENAGDNGGWYRWNVAKWSQLGRGRNATLKVNNGFGRHDNSSSGRAALMAGQVLSGCTCGAECSACHRGEPGYLDHALKCVGS